jgi:hypothetical protein
MDGKFSIKKRASNGSLGPGTVKITGSFKGGERAEVDGDRRGASASDRLRLVYRQGCAPGREKRADRVTRRPFGAPRRRSG